MASTDKTPQPVVNTQLVAQGIALVLSILVALGFITTGESDALADVGVYVIGGIPLVAALVAAFKARKVVTPNAAPKDMNGEPLATALELRAVSNGAYSQGHAAGQDAAVRAAERERAEARAASGTPVAPEEIEPAQGVSTKELAALNGEDDAE